MKFFSNNWLSPKNCFCVILWYSRWLSLKKKKILNYNFFTQNFRIHSSFFPACFDCSKFLSKRTASYLLNNGENWNFSPIIVSNVRIKKNNHLNWSEGKYNFNTFQLDSWQIIINECNLLVCWFTYLPCSCLMVNSRWNTLHSPAKISGNLFFTIIFLSFFVLTPRLNGQIFNRILNRFWIWKNLIEMVNARLFKKYDI